MQNKHALRINPISINAHATNDMYIYPAIYFIN